VARRTASTDDGDELRLQGRVEVPADADAAARRQQPVAPAAQCAPPALGSGRLAWADIRSRSSLIPRKPCHEAAGDAAGEVALCEVASAVAGDASELVLVVGVGSRAASLNVTLRTAAHALGSRRLLLLALDEAAARVGAALRVPTFRVVAAAGVTSALADERRAAPRAALVLVRAGLRVLLSATSGVAFAADPFGGLAGDADVEVLSEGWDEVTAGGHIHGIGDEAMGWSQYSESLRISYANPSLVALQPTPHTAALLLRLLRGGSGGDGGGGGDGGSGGGSSGVDGDGGSSGGLDAARLTDELFGPSYDGVVRGGVHVRALRPDCYATAERALRGMAPHAIAVSGAGAAEYAPQLAAGAAATAGAAAAAVGRAAGRAAGSGAVVALAEAEAEAEAEAATLEAIESGQPAAQTRPRLAARLAGLPTAGTASGPAAAAVGAAAASALGSVSEQQRGLRDDAIWSTTLRSASAAVTAGCAASAAVAAPAAGGSARLDPVVPQSAPFPADCGSRQEEDGPGGLEAVCATVRKVFGHGGDPSGSRELLIAISNRNILSMLGLYMDGVRRAGVRRSVVVTLDEATTRYVADHGGGVTVAHERKLVARGGTGNHATSGLKFRILVPWLKVGCNVLLSDVDIVYLRNPFATGAPDGDGDGGASFLYRDADVEAMTDGWSDETAYGWHMKLLGPEAPPAGDDGDGGGGGGGGGTGGRTAQATADAAAARQPAAARRMIRFWARNSGQFYVRATSASLRMMRTLARRMEAEQVWDQSAYSQQGLWPALADARTGSGGGGAAGGGGGGGREGSRVHVRILNYACWCNTKFFFRHLLNEPRWRDHRPVSVHTNYHPEKQQRMQSIFDHYHKAGGGGGGGGGDVAALRRWSGTQGMRQDACVGPTRPSPHDEMVEMSSRGPWLFHNVPPRTPAQLLAAADAAGRAAPFVGVRFLAGGKVALEAAAVDVRAAAAAPTSVRARAAAVPAPPAGQQAIGSWEASGRGGLTLQLYGDKFAVMRRGRALVCTRCSDGLEVFARYEGLTCNSTGWRRLGAASDTLRRSRAAARTLQGDGLWSWQGRHAFKFHPDGRLETPWHKGVWGVAADRDSDAFVFARFANIDHLLHLAGNDRMDSVRCEDGDKVQVYRGAPRMK